MTNQDYKKITFQVDTLTASKIDEYAKSQYLSVSAYIRKCIDIQLDKEKEKNELR